METRDDERDISSQREKAEQTIKQKLLKRFGKTAIINPETGEVKINEAHVYDDPQVIKNIRHNCNEVSRIVSEIIDGDRKIIKADGINPAIKYNDGEKEREIASGLSTAIHAFVVDDEGKVWDPITNEWGENDIEYYRDKVVTDNAERIEITLA